MRQLEERWYLESQQSSCSCNSDTDEFPDFVEFFEFLARGRKMLFQESGLAKRKVAIAIGSLMMVAASAMFSSIALSEDEEMYLPGASYVQLSEEDGLEPFDVKRIANLVSADMIDQEAFFKLYDQGVSEEQLVAVLKKVYARKELIVDDAFLANIVHEQLFPTEKSVVSTRQLAQVRASAKSDDCIGQAEEKDPKKDKKKLKKGPDYPYVVQKLSNTFCGPDADYVLDYNLDSAYFNNKSKIRWYHKDWWMRLVFVKITVSVCQSPAKACLGGDRMEGKPISNPALAWDLQLWLEK